MTDREKFTMVAPCEPDLPDQCDLSVVLAHMATKWETAARDRGCEPDGPPVTRFDTEIFLPDGQYLPATLSAVGWIRPVTQDAIAAAEQRASEASA